MLYQLWAFGPSILTITGVFLRRPRIWNYYLILPFYTHSRPLVNGAVIICFCLEQYHLRSLADICTALNWRAPKAAALKAPQQFTIDGTAIFDAKLVALLIVCISGGRVS